MIFNVKLKNAAQSVLLDAASYEYLTTDSYLVACRFVENLRLHSSGCVVFQRAVPRGSHKGLKTETIYLHKLLAEVFLGDQKTSEKYLAGTINGDKLDCRIENITWRTRANASRLRKPSNAFGYTGVYQEKKRYRAVITAHGKSIHIGMYDTAAAAAQAYNQKSRELFGDEGKQNVIRAED